MLDWLRRLRAPRVERKLLAWHAPGRPVWSARDPAVFAREGYARNAIAYRCVRMIAEAAASAPLKVGPADHPLARLLARLRRRMAVCTSADSTALRAGLW